MITAADGNASNDIPMRGRQHPLVPAPYVAAPPIASIPALAAEEGERLRMDVRAGLFGYANEARPAPEGKIPVPSLAEATMAHCAVALGLGATPEHAFAQPAVRPLVLLNEILTNIG